MRIIADTNVWIDHLAQNSASLRHYLEEGEILLHPLIIGEIALGCLAQRELILEYLAQMPLAPSATDQEVLHCINERELYGRGIGIADSGLLCSTLLSPDTLLWTNDKRLAHAADECGVAYAP